MDTMFFILTAELKIFIKPLTDLTMWLLGLAVVESDTISPFSTASHK